MCISTLSSLLLIFFKSFLLKKILGGAAPHGMWDVSSLAMDGAHVLCSGSGVLTTGPPGKSLRGLGVSCGQSPL